MRFLKVPSSLLRRLRPLVIAVAGLALVAGLLPGAAAPACGDRVDCLAAAPLTAEWSDHNRLVLAPIGEFELAKADLDDADDGDGVRYTVAEQAFDWARQAQARADQARPHLRSHNLPHKTGPPRA